MQKKASNKHKPAFIFNVLHHQLPLSFSIEPVCPIRFGPRREKPCLRGGGGGANNKVADQPVHPRSLISAYLIRLLESIIFRPAASEIFFF